ncbi:MAG TPA: radical SAM protein [Desulfomonilaceae bacterium]|nr:radical SAM protein [Desulfomonilaceae bacterium]
MALGDDVKGVAVDLARLILPRRARQAVYGVLAIARVSKPVTRLLGPTHRTNQKRIEIILTFECDLMCVDCSIQCKQAPSREQMNVDQICRFIEESVAQQRRWEIIRLIGGEPTLHPSLSEILESLAAYKRDFSPLTKVELCTNGYRSCVQEIVARVPAGIEVDNSRKTSPFQKHHVCVNNAPLDHSIHRYSDYSNGCSVCVSQGMGLSPYGYYHCNVAAAIDRVFGVDLGRKTLPAEGDGTLDSSCELCRYCGFFPRRKRDRSEPGYVSRTWRLVLEKYFKQAPAMTRY